MAGDTRTGDPDIPGHGGFLDSAKGLIDDDLHQRVGAASGPLNGGTSEPSRAEIENVVGLHRDEAKGEHRIMTAHAGDVPSEHRGEASEVSKIVSWKTYVTDPISFQLRVGQKGHCPKGLVSRRRVCQDSASAHHGILAGKMTS